MTVFLAIAALLTLLVVGWLMRALLRPAAGSHVSSEHLNASIYRDQLQALERDLARGTLSAADYEATRDELQLRLLEDTDAPQLAPAIDGASSPRSGRRTALIVAIVVPLAAAGMYAWLGEPAAMDPAATQVSANSQVEQMVQGLAARLKANPDDRKGWATLARSYKVMGRLDEAEQAFLKAGDAINGDPELLVAYADLLAVRADHNIAGRPLELVQQALALDPKHPMGLMMAGVAAYREGDFKTAVSYWEKLLAVLPPDSDDAKQIESNIAEARSRAAAASGAKAGQPNGPSAGKLPPVDTARAGAVTPEKINQMVEGLAARLKSQPDDLAGWARLARAYRVLGRLEESEQAYVKAGKLVDGDPDLLTQYADLLAMRAGNQLEGRPLALLNKALALDAKHPMALMMAGSAAFRRADYALAITHWEKALTVLEPGSQHATLVASEIADARAKLKARQQAGAKP